MKRLFNLAGLALIAITILQSEALAQKNRPIQIALINPVQIFKASESIVGIRLNLIYGRNASVKGLDWGLINHTTSGITKAWQAGFIGINNENFLGFQDNWVNVTKGDCEGLQLGVVNYARDMHGLQLGLVNFAETTYGLQVGLVNIISQDGAFPVFPIVNWSF